MIYYILYRCTEKALGKLKIQGVIREFQEQGEYTSTLFLYMWPMWYMCLYDKSDTCVYLDDYVTICIWLKSLDLYEMITWICWDDIQ